MCLQPESELRQHLPHRVDDLCLELGFVRLHVLLPCLLISKLSSATLLKGLFEPKHNSFRLLFGPQMICLNCRERRIQRRYGCKPTWLQISRFFKSSLCWARCFSNSSWSFVLKPHFSRRHVRPAETYLSQALNIKKVKYIFVEDQVLDLVRTRFI